MLGSIGVVAAGLAFAPFAVATGSPGARAIARAINLRAGDVPGFNAEGSGNNQTGNLLEGRSLRSCPDSPRFAPHNGSVEVGSPLFTSSSGIAVEKVQSEVDIDRSGRIVARHLALVRSAEVRVCLKRTLEGFTVTEHGIQEAVTDVQVMRLRVHAAGVERTAGLRVKMSVTALSVSVPVTLDLIGFGVGRDEVYLLTGGVGESFPQKTEQQLLSLLVSRALTHRDRGHPLQPVGGACTGGAGCQNGQFTGNFFT